MSNQETENKPNNGLAFGKRNYQIMLLGIILIVTGFVIMALEPGEYGFGFLGLTLGPVVVMAGFIVEIFAILHNPKQNK